MYSLLVNTEPMASARQLFYTIVFFFKVLMGMGTVQVYAAELFSKAVPGLSADFCSVLFALVSFGGVCVTTAVADKVGRRVCTCSLLLFNCFQSIKSVFKECTKN